MPSRASSALSAAICGAVPATTTTLSARISVSGKAGCSLPRSQSPTTLRPVRSRRRVSRTSTPASGVSRTGSSAICTLAERADDVRLGAAGVHAIGQRLAELALQRQHRRGAAQLQDVDRVLLLDDRGDVHVRRDLADGQRDVRVDRVLAVGDDEPRGGRAQPLVGRAAVVLAGDDGEVLADEPRRLRGIRLDDEIRNAGGAQPLDQPDGDRVVLGDDDVPGRSGRTSRGARSRMRDSSQGA